jgi:hypothetical protein
MFKALVNELGKQLQGAKGERLTDPSRFGHPVAEKTEWSPLVRGGSNFRTHRLKSGGLGRMEFRPTVGLVAFASAFVVIGLGLMVAGVSEMIERMAAWIGVAFALAGGLIGGLGLRPVVFDREKGYFYKGWKKPESMIDPGRLKGYAELKHIVAIQLIGEWVSGSGRNSRSYMSYELNLVLEDGARLHVVDHGSLEGIRRDAHTLGDYLGKPVWDAS